MAKLTPLEAERLDVAEAMLGRFLRLYKTKERKGKALTQLQNLETLANLMSAMRISVCVSFT